MFQPEIKVVGLSSQKIENNEFLCLIPAGIINDFYESNFFWKTITGSIFLLTFLEEKKLILPQDPNRIHILTKQKRKGDKQAFRRGAYILIPPEVLENNRLNSDKFKNSLQSYIAWVHLKEGYYLASLA